MRFALIQFIGAALVVDGHEQVGIQNAVDQFDAERQCQLKTACFFESGKVQRDDRNLWELLCHAFPEQVDVVGCPTAAARLGDEQGSFVGVIFAAFQSLHKLPNNKQCRVTGIVVDIFQPFFYDRTGGRFQQFHVITELPEDGDQQPKVNRQHIRH